VLEAVRTPRDLPQSVISAFVALGKAQRGAPETAMTSAKEALGSGVLSYVIEHVGDLTHHMTNRLGFFGANTGYKIVHQKVKNSLFFLTSGFAREAAENMTTNARVRRTDLEQYKRQADAALTAYAHAHTKLPVYNKAQWLARNAAISLGLRRYDVATANLEELANMLATSATWDRHALSFLLNPDGSLRIYAPT
jgi:hypothetical protein